MADFEFSNDELENNSEIATNLFRDYKLHFMREEIRSNLQRFEWLPVREQLNEDKLEKFQPVKYLKNIFKETGASVLIVAGAAGCGKTKLLYEFAKDNKKDTCFFVHWQATSASRASLMEEFERLPAKPHYFLFDDVDQNPKKAALLANDLLALNARVVLAVRDEQDLLKFLKDFSIEKFEILKLKKMENLAELLEFVSEPWLTPENKEKILTLAVGNPEILSLVCDVIEQQKQQAHDFEVVEFLNSIPDREALLQKIMQFIETAAEPPALEFITRAVLFQGINRSSAYCKANFRYYIKLRSLNYFYVQQDRLFFKPALLGEYIARQVLFPGNELSPIFSQLIDDAEFDQLESIISSLKMLHQHDPLPGIWDALGLVLASTNNKSMDDVQLARLILFFDELFKAPKIVFDSVENIFELKMNAAEPELINQLAIFFAENGIHQSAARTWETLLEIARNQNYEGWLTVCYNNLGQVYLHLNDYDNAIECYHLALDRFEASDTVSGVIQSLVNISQIYQKKGEWERSVEVLKKAIKQYEKIKDTRGAARTLINIAQLYRNHNQLDQAIIHYEATRSYLKKIGDTKRLAQVYGNLGLISKSRNDLDAAVEYFSKAIAAARQIEDDRTLAYSYNNLALVYQEKGDFDQAIEYYQLSIKELTAINDSKSRSLALSNLAQIYHSKNDWDNALQSYEKVLEFKRQTNDRQGIAETVNSMGNIFQAKEDWQTAADYYIQAARQADLLEEPVLATLLGNLGLVLQKQQKYHEAVNAFRKAAEYMLKGDDLSGLAKTYGNLGLTYFLMKKYPKAITLLNEVLFFYLKEKTTHNVREVSRILSEIQNLMDKNEFNKIADKALNNAARLGINWQNRRILSSAEVKKILNQLKLKKKQRQTKPDEPEKSETPAAD